MTATDPRLLRHYNDELLYLRRRAVEFSEEHRQVAGRLGIDAPTDPDPHVERLLEGVAYLNARVQLRLDDQFPAFTQYLLDALYPHYLAPTPAMAILQYVPREGDEALIKGVVHPRGSAIQAWLDGDAHARVQFRTGLDVTLWPIRVAAVEYLPTRASVAGATDAAQGAAGLRIRLAATSPAALSALAIDTLPMFVDGGQDMPNLLFQQMMTDCIGVRVCSPERGRRDPWSVAAGTVEAMGFGADEALLPGDARSFRGYRLLCEYFAMPEKFRFARLTGLAAGFARAEREVDIVLVFGRPVDALVGSTSTDTLKLFATPAINLFERRFDRVIVDRRREEHLVIPDRVGLLDYEVYRLGSVTGYARGEAQGAPALPLYARRAQRGVRPLYYALKRRLRRLSELETRQRRESDYIGTETWISLSSPDDPMLARNVAELGITGLVTNRALATRLRPGQANLRILVDEARGVGDMHGRALVPCAGNEARDALGLSRGHEWAHLRRGVEAVANCEAVRIGDHTRDHLVVDRAVHVEPRAGDADLPCVEEDRVGDAGDGEVEIGVGQHDRGRLAAEFERDALEVGLRRIEDRAAGLGRAGERDLVDPRMRGERSAGLAAQPGDDVEHARGQPRLRHQFAEPEGAERGVLRRFQDDRAAGRQRGGELHRGQHQRRVPRHDCRDHADGFAESPGRDLLARRLVIDRAFDRIALDRHRLAGEKAELVDRTGDLGPARDEQRLALVKRLQFGEFVDMRLD
ncbi:type VI secretion system VasI/ImpG family protein [Sphingomonas sp. PP-F2F-A104-K0414]|nr:type VI secretion system VasI/ImpG family protein [Sphingomonas sp. PP-F2F-A104-K0414]